MVDFNYDAELETIQAEFTKNYISTHTLKKELFLAKRYIEENNDKICRKGNLSSNLLALSTILLTMIIAVLTFSDGIPIIIKIIMLLVPFSFECVSLYKELKGNDKERYKVFFENRRLHLKVEVIEKELRRRSRVIKNVTDKME